MIICRQNLEVDLGVIHIFNDFVINSNILSEN